MKKALISFILSLMTVTTGVAVGTMGTALIGGNEDFVGSSGGGFVIKSEGFHLTETNGGELMQWNANLKPTAKSTTERYTIDNTTSDFELIKSDPKVANKSVILKNLYEESRVVRLRINLPTNENPVNNEIIFLLLEVDGVPATWAYAVSMFAVDYRKSSNLVINDFPGSSDVRLTFYAWVNGVHPSANNSAIGKTLKVEFELVALTAAEEDAIKNLHL